MDINGVCAVMNNLSATAKKDIASELMTKEYWPQGHSIQVWPVWHRECRDIAFFYNRPIVGPVRSANVLDYSGKRPDPHSPIICGACHATVMKNDLCEHRPGELIAMPGENPIIKILRQ